VLPSNVERSIYQADNINRLMASPRWRDLVFRIENDIDDGGGQINVTLDQFIDKVVGSYRHPAQAGRAHSLVI
jgi:hypothetical protein